jgi:hypothetical protein
MLLLIFYPYFFILPYALVLETPSLPAKSTILIQLLVFEKSSWTISTFILNIAWDLDEDIFRLLEANFRLD